MQFLRLGSLALLGLMPAIPPPAAPSTAPSAGAPATLHGGPPIALTLAIADENAFLAVSAEPDVLAGAVGYGNPFSDLDDTDAHTAAFRFLDEHLRAAPPLSSAEAAKPLRLSRLEELREVTDAGGLHSRIEFELTLPLAEPARSVSLVWHDWEGVQFEGETYVPVLIRFGADIELVSLTPAEPEYVWHTRELRPRTAVVAQPGETRAREVPAVSLALGAVALAIALLGRRLPLSPSTRAGVLSALLVGAFLTRGRALVPIGSAGARVALPTEAQAAQLFDALHRNVYAAFDASSEDEIYDLLATSVDARLLDEIYGEVYESLVLREEGGAVCEIDEVTVLSSAVTLPDEDADVNDRFDVEHAWRVHGLVAHWGHVHERTHRYRATYVVRHDGESWKIWDVNVHRQEREAPQPEVPAGDG